MRIISRPREAFYEWVIGSVRILFFEPQLWSLHWPKCDKWTDMLPDVDAAVDGEIMKPRMRHWAIVFPTMSISGQYLCR